MDFKRFKSGPVLTLLIVIISIGFSMVASSETNNSEPKTKLFADPELIGPEKLCNVFGSVIGVFSGGGDPSTDVYKWTIIGPDGSILFTRPAGAFPTIEYTFELIGAHKVSVEVSRGGRSIAKLEKEVDVIKGPEFSLANAYKLCEGQTINIQAISPGSANFSDYIFEWTNESDQIIGTSNTLEINSIGKYSVTFYFPDSDGTPVCNNTLSTEVTILESISIIESSSTVCRDGSITFTSEPLTIGQWILTIPGESNQVELGNVSSVTLIPERDLPTFGEYNIEIIVENSDNPSCRPFAKSTFTYNEQPSISVSSVTGASGCFIPDGGLFLLAETNLDLVSVGLSGPSYGPYLAGETIEIPNLKSGGYTLYSYLNGCQNTLGAVVPLIDPPLILEFEIENITSESCTTNGKTLGSFEVEYSNSLTEGSFRVINEKGDVTIKDALPTTNPFRIELAGGKYYFEILDKDSCNLPTREFIEIPSKPQTLFSIPDSLTICGSFDLIPDSQQNLLFTLTDPSGNVSSANTGDSFTLTEEGEYSLIGTIPNQDNICPSERKFFVSKTEPIPFQPRLKSEDCVIGNRVYEADIFGYDPALADFIWRNEIGETIGTGQDLFLSPTSIGTFSLEVQPKDSENCPISPIEFTVEKPVLFVDATIKTTKLCEFGPEAIVELITTSPEAVTDIRWRRFNEEGEIIPLPEFDNQNVITTRIGGIYEASAYSINSEIKKNCELGRATFQLDLTPDKVQFDIPEKLVICDFYEIFPQTNQSLDFFLTTPSGNIIEKPSGQSFTIDEAGLYIFLAFDSNSPTPFCPEQKELEVELAEPVVFKPILSEEFCDGSSIYQASISNYDLADVIISWKDRSGNEIGIGEFLTINNSGDYSLEVQPANVTPCHISPKFFEVPEPLLALDVNLIASPFCPDALDAAISVETELDKVAVIEWWLTDLNGNQFELVNQKNKPEILATQEGTYEVRIFNSVPCLIGSDLVLLTRSMDQVRPIVEESYQICPRYDIAPTINPGDFASYEWYFGDQLVSTSSSYKPLLVGQFDLVVYSEEGCTYSTSFETIEECELKVVFPNALELGNPDKNFLIYTNYLVDELEVWIYNKWGELIFNCKNTDLIKEESTCFWDGTLNGDKIPNGAYSIRVNYKNYAKEINEIYLGSLMVIE